MRYWGWGVLLACAASAGWADATLTFGAATLKLADDGRVTSSRLGDQELTAPTDAAAIEVETDQGVFRPTAVTATADGLDVRFGARGSLRLTATPGDGFCVLRVARLQVPGTVQRLRVFALPVQPGGTLAGLINARYDDQTACAVMATSLNVQALNLGPTTFHSDNAGCTHRFERVTDPAKSGGAVRFTATSQRTDNNGWSSGRQPLAARTDLTGLRQLRLFVYGDNSGALLKIQLRDALNGARDTTLPLNFSGWKAVVLTKPEYDTLHYDQVTSVDLYYNGLPAGKTASVVIDHIQAVVGEGTDARSLLLADFDAPTSPLWTGASQARQLAAQSYARHGIEPAGVGVIACRRADFETTIERFERAAGLPSPHPDGVWSKASPRTRQSYLLVLKLIAADVDDVIAFAQRAHLTTILIFQADGMWCSSTGHYPINTTAWPQGLASLKAACDKIHRAGLKVGFHYLGASIYPPDPYVAPVPDPRLVKDAAAELGADLAVAATTIPLSAAPAGFPAKDVDYLGTGAVVQIDQELIHYNALATQPPYGLLGCTRGYHGTVAATHARGAKVAHMQRSYGYYLYDMDTPILGEIADHVTKVLNTCGADMVYWDGSEQLQNPPADHWYYNAKLHQAFYERLRNKDIVCQGSSLSHWSWHIHGRLASADGHGDLKGYLDERRPNFKWYRENLLPVDIGWYGVYDMAHGVDEFEYILNKSLGYDSSISFGIIPDLLRRHPFLGAIADRIGAYEVTRAAGGAPPATRAAVQAPGRREYRLTGAGRTARLDRILAEPRHDVVDDRGESNVWEVEVKDQPCRVAVELAVVDRWAGPSPAWKSNAAVTLETFSSLKPYLAKDDPAVDTMVIGEGKAGLTKEGVTQRFELKDGAPGGGTYASYTATSALPSGDGWSAIGRQLEPPVDLSQHLGVGFWLQGDGRLGQFKLQLRDEVGAADWYITNDFVGWRFIQLPFATASVYRTLAWKRISRVFYYYNSLPAKTTVTCGLAGLKALKVLDRPVLAQPALELDGRRLAWDVTLDGAGRLYWWPGEPTRLSQPGRDTTLPSPEAVTLVPGRHRVKFSAATATAAVGVQLWLLPPESLPASG